MFANINVLLRNVILGGLLVLGGWWTYFLREQVVVVSQGWGGHDESTQREC